MSPPGDMAGLSDRVLEELGELDKLARSVRRNNLEHSDAETDLEGTKVPPSNRPGLWKQTSQTNMSNRLCIPPASFKNSSVSFNFRKSSWWHKIFSGPCSAAKGTCRGHDESSISPDTLKAVVSVLREPLRGDMHPQDSSFLGGHTKVLLTSTCTQVKQPIHWIEFRTSKLA